MNLSNYSFFSNLILAPFCLKIKEFSSGVNSNSAPTISDLNKFFSIASKDICGCPVA